MQTEEVEALLAEMDAYKEKYNKSFREKASLDVELVETKGLVDIFRVTIPAFVATAYGYSKVGKNNPSNQPVHGALIIQQISRY